MKKLGLGNQRVFVASLFVLGGNFWDEIRALFVRAASVVERDAA